VGEFGGKNGKNGKKRGRPAKIQTISDHFSDHFLDRRKKNFPQALTKIFRYDRMKKPAGVAPGRSSLIIFYLKGRRNHCKQKNDYENENEKFFHFSVLLVRVKLL